MEKLKSCHLTFLIDNKVRENLINIMIGELISLSNNKSYQLDELDFFYSPNNGYDFHKRTNYSTDCFIMPSYNVQRMPEQYARAVKTNSNIVVNHAEQMFPKLLQTEKLNLKNKPAYQKQVTGHLTWGSFFSNQLINKAGIENNKIYITGNPKLEIADLFFNEKNEISIKEYNNKNILIVSDFLLADLNDKEWQQWKNKYNCHYQEPINKIYESARINAIQWVLEAAKKFPKLNFNFRIHPGEDKSRYGQFEELSNVHVSGEKNFVEEVKASNLVFSFTSTSIFEVLALGKQVFNLDLVNVPQERFDNYFELFKMVSFNEFLKIVEEFNEGKEFTPENDRLKLVDKYMYHGKNKPILRTAIAIHEIHKKCSNKRLNHNLNSILQYSIATAKDSLVKLAFYLKNELRVNNWLASKVHERHLDHIKLNEYLSLEEITSTKKKVIDNLKDEYLDVLKNEKYILRQEAEGIYIDL